MRIIANHLLTLAMALTAVSARAIATLDLPASLNRIDSSPIESIVSFEPGDRLTSLTAQGVTLSHNCPTVVQSTAGTCLITLTPPAFEAGREITVKVVLNTNKGRVQKNLNLIFEGSNSAELDLSATVDLGSVNFPGSIVKELTIKNIGKVATTGLTAVISGNNFKMRTNLCNGRILAANQSCKIQLQFDAPNLAPGIQIGQLSFEDTSGELASTVLSINLLNSTFIPPVTGIIQIVLSEEAFTIEPPALKKVTATVKNGTNVAMTSILSPTIIGQGWTIRSSTCYVALQPNAFCKLNLEFRAEGLSAGQYPTTVSAGGVSASAMASVIVEEAPTVYTLTVSKIGLGTVISAPAGINCGTTCLAQFESGSEIVLTATPSTNQTITWGGACSSETGNTCSLAAITESQNVSVEFVNPIILRTLTILDGGVIGVPNSQTWAYGSQQAYQFADGTSLSLTPANVSGFHFTGWNSCLSVIGNTCQINLTENLTIFPIFAPNTYTPTYPTNNLAICGGTQNVAATTCAQNWGNNELVSVVTFCPNPIVHEAPAGEVIINILNGEKTVSCQQGSDNQALVSIRCDQGFTSVGSSCFAEIIPWEVAYSDSSFVPAGVIVPSFPVFSPWTTQQNVPTPSHGTFSALGPIATTIPNYSNNSLSANIDVTEKIILPDSQGDYSYDSSNFLNFTEIVSSMVNKMINLNSNWVPVKIYKTSLATSTLSYAPPSSAGVLVDPGFKVFKNELYFSAVLDYRYRLFKIKENGEEVQVANIAGPSGSDNPRLLTVGDGELFFAASLYLVREKMFKIDKNTEQIVQLTNLKNNLNDGISSIPMITLNGSLYFVGTNSSGYTKLFRVHPSANLVSQVTDIRLNNNDSPEFLTAFNNEIYFSARSPTGLLKLYKSNDSNQVSQVVTLRAGTETPENLKVFNNHLYFTGNAGPGDKLYKLSTNGVVTQVTNIIPGSRDTIKSLFEWDNELYFGARISGSESKVFKVDTLDQVTQLSNINQGGFDSFGSPTIFNNSLYFVSNSAVFKINKLGIVTQITNAPSTFAPPSELTVFNDELFFVAGTHIAEISPEVYGDVRKIFKINKKDEVSQVVDIRGSQVSDNPRYLIESNGRLYFTANHLTGQRIFKIILE